MQSDEQQIRELIATWMKATRAGDIEAILGLMTNDVVFLQPGQARPQFDGTSEIQEIKVLGDWAYMWTKLSVVVTPPGSAAQMTRAGHTLSVLKKENGRWLLARD